MKRCACILLFWMNVIYAHTSDPFAKPTKKILFNQRYIYLGYIAFQKQKWALIKPVSKDIERIGLGKAPGLGFVKMINESKVCVEKNKHLYCLYKSSQAGVWR
jgi:hypothetical protein